MLREVISRKQPDRPRRWFTDADNDLFIWLDHSQHPVAFQFSYNKLHDEHCFSWSESGGYNHDRIDDGESVSMNIKRTPILVPDGSFDHHSLACHFATISHELAPELTEFVLDRIRDYPG